MKKTLLLILSAIVTTFSFSQTTLYQNDFTAGPAGWQLGQGGNFNFWIVNNVYNCSYPTANQGGGNYMHVYDDLSPDYCAVYNILGMGSGGTVYSTMTNGFSTVGQPTVTVQFDWLCQGQTGPLLSTFGFVDYSTDGGNTWINITMPLTQFNGQPAWTAHTITSAQEPGILNQSNLRFRFGFTSSGYGTNPAFAIDNILITGSLSTAVTETAAENIFSVYPNPSNGIFIINMEDVKGQMAEVEIYNALGQKVYKSEVKSQKQEIDLSTQVKGIYFVKMIADDKVYSQKIAIQ